MVAVLLASAGLVLTRPIRLGLDLRGGTQIVLEGEATDQQDVDADAISRTVEVLRRRVDQLGVSEPTLQRSGDRRIIIELPGVTDPDEALEVVGRTAQLTFRPVLGIPSPEVGNSRRDERDDETVLPDEDGQQVRLGPTRLTGDAVSDAEAVVDGGLGGAWQVSLSFRSDGAEEWGRLTGEAACEPLGDPQRRVAIVLDDEVLSSPQVGAEVECEVGIRGGPTVITGGFTEEEAKDLALLIRAGALPVPVTVVEQRTIGPTLGAEAVRASVQAALIGGALTVLYVVAYYRLLGALAGLALLAYGLMSFAVLLALNATLTLPGVAGFVLAIGMAVDANVLVFERSKEEFATGKRLKTALSRGFEKAWSAIADSNATTLLAAIILFNFASGPVRGFGITLTVGVIVSMFTALVVTRVLVDLASRSKRLMGRPGVMGMSVGDRFRRFLEQRDLNLFSRMRWWFAISAGVLILAVSGLATRGLSFGLEFTGGRLLVYSTERPVDVDAVRDAVARAGFPRAVVQISGETETSIRAPELSGADEAKIEAAVAEVGGDAGRVRDEFIGPTIGDELRQRALIALGLGLGAQLLYLAIRFRWTFGLSAVAALFHDVMILLGIFAWLGKDIDGVFIASLLTVIGYSINDSVVVFDRIREHLALKPKEPLSSVANAACLQTVPRTINTGLGALFILLALYFLGGKTLTDFALALIVGILVGTYSSIFTAAPLAVIFEGAAPREGTQRPTSATPPPVRTEQPKARPSPDTDLRPAARAQPPARRRAGASKRKRRKR